MVFFTAMNDGTRRRNVLPIAALLLLGSVALVRLSALPAFEDEGTELRWIWRAIDAGEWLQPLGDGKPLQVWPMVPWVWLGLPPLAVMRVANVLAGMIGASLTYGLARQLCDRWAALACGVLFAVCPFVVYLQRLALAEMFLCTAGLWALLCALLLVERPTTRRAMLLAASLVLAAFSKFPVGFLFILATPLGLLLMPGPSRRTLLCRPVLGRLLAAHAPVLVLAMLVILVATLRARRGQSPGFGLGILAVVGMGHDDVARALGVPGIHLGGELAAQLSWPVVVLGAIGAAASAVLGDWRQRWLVVVGAMPMLGMGLLAGFWYPRYLLFTLPPLIIGAVLGWRSLSRNAGRLGRPLEILALAICAAFMGRQSALLVLDPPAASWSPVDRVQYFEGSGSGYGYPEAASFILASPEVPAMIYALDGHSPYQLCSYLPPSWRARVTPVFYGEDGRVLRTEADRLKRLLGGGPAWIVIPEPLLPFYLDSSFGPAGLEQISLREVAKFDKPGTRARLALYAVARR